MSKLTFSQSAHTIILTSADYKILGVWKAHNEIQAVSIDEKGTKHHHFRWPIGTWRWLAYKAHAEDGLNPAAFHASYGGLGIHLFNVPIDGGDFGVHCGRTIGAPFQLGGKTYGCIRVTREAMNAINSCHRSGDRLGSITVES